MRGRYFEKQLIKHMFLPCIQGALCCVGCCGSEVCRYYFRIGYLVFENGRPTHTGCRRTDRDGDKGVPIGMGTDRDGDKKHNINKNIPQTHPNAKSDSP